MTDEVLEKALERIADAAYRSEIYDTPESARFHLVTGSPKLTSNLTRDAVIEAIAIKGLDPGRDTSLHFRRTLGEFLNDDLPCDRALPKLFDKIVGDTVRALTEERLLGRKSDLGSKNSAISR